MLLPGDGEARRAIAHLRGKLSRLKEMRLEGEYTREEYMARKTQLLEELQEWERQAGRGGNNGNHAFLDLGNVAEVIQQGPPAAQKKAIIALFERLEVDQQGQITKAIPREWCRPLFS